MTEVDEGTLNIIRRHCRQLAIQNEGKVTFRDVMLALGKELERDAIRNLISVIKKEIEVVNTKSLEELKEADEADEGEGIIENEYDELATNFKDKMEKKDFVSSLLTYGSYGKGNHIMGQSNLNFLLILKDYASEDSPKQEKVGQEIREVIESLMNPLYEYLFDLVILFENNVESIEAFKNRMGPGFTAIHAYSASNCSPLIGVNPFSKMNLSAELQISAKMIMKDTINQYKEGKKDVEAEIKQFRDEKNDVQDEAAGTDDLAYLSSEAIIDYALALIYSHLKEDQASHITKPDIREKFKEVFSNNNQYKVFIAAVEQAFAYRMGISKIGDGVEITGKDLIKFADNFTLELDKMIKI